jgi:saccharopine dehydrogenase-like NADP-dependent oxidoreductase
MPITSVDTNHQALEVAPDALIVNFTNPVGLIMQAVTQVTDARKIYAGEFMGHRCSAIQITTAASLCAVVDLHASGKLPTQGFVKQEQVKLDDFLANRFGGCYDVQMRPLMKATAPARV